MSQLKVSAHMVWIS